MKETNKSRNKSKMAAVIAVLLVCVLAVGGTIAYLTPPKRNSKMSSKTAAIQKIISIIFRNIFIIDLSSFLFHV